MNSRKEAQVGQVIIGGKAPIVVQSMTKTQTTDIEGTIKQIESLQAAGCSLVRLAVNSRQAVEAFSKIRWAVKIPLVADVHFDYQLALAVCEKGADKLRINPANIGGEARLVAVIKAAKAYQIPIRLGINAGSFVNKKPKNSERSYHSTAQAEAKSLVDLALEYIKIFEKNGFESLVLSIKSSSVLTTIEAYRKLAKQVDYPLHLGVTEAGTFRSGSIKSAVGIGTLLAEGIGDTIRVSLTDDPVKEVEVAYQILRSLGLCSEGVEVISCPTCGRCEIDVAKIASTIEEATRNLKTRLKVAVMGCSVNGPGEAKEADLGIAGGRGSGLLFKNGQMIKKVPSEQLVEVLLSKIQEMAGEKI